MPEKSPNYQPKFLKMYKLKRQPKKFSLSTFISQTIRYKGEWRKTDFQLTDKQKDNLFDLLKGSSRARNRYLLKNTIYHHLPHVKSYGIYERVIFEGDRVSYCAGQDYPGEITIVRNLLIG